MMAGVCWELPALFTTALMRKVAINDLKDLCNAKQVCRTWRDAGDGDEFNRKLLEECLDVTEVENTECFFESYKDAGNWFRYWEHSEDEDEDSHYVFRPIPVRTSAGFLTIPNADLSRVASPQALGLIQSLLDLGHELKRVEARVGFGNESDSDLYPIVIPWKSGMDLSPQNVVPALGGNPILLHKRGLYVQDFSERKHHVRMGVIFDNDDPAEDGGDVYGGGMVCRRFRKFMFARGVPLIFYAGSEMLNPLPLFYLRKLTDNLVGGFIGSLVHT